MSMTSLLPVLLSMPLLCATPPPPLTLLPFCLPMPATATPYHHCLPHLPLPHHTCNIHFPTCLPLPLPHTPSHTYLPRLPCLLLFSWTLGSFGQAGRFNVLLAAPGGEGGVSSSWLGVPSPHCCIIIITLFFPPSLLLCLPRLILHTISNLPHHLPHHT